MTVEELWSECVDELRGELPDATWQLWLSQISPKALCEDRVEVSVPNHIVRDRVETRLAATIASSLSILTGRPMALSVVVVAEDLPTTEPAVAPSASLTNAPVPVEQSSVSLSPYFTFESFLIAGSNRLAHAASQAVAETPGRSYNPLFIYGDSGLGKTHLLHAIGNYVSAHYPRYNVLYVTTETFMNDFVDSLRNNSTMAFKRRYRVCDVLLIDDVQFMEKKDGLQEEFFHTYNDLYGAGKQIVLTSDRPPKSIESLEDRLRSRFLSGLITEIDPPDFETRLAILRKKSEIDAEQIPDEVLAFIAHNVKHNVRELEGALIRVSAFSRLSREPLNVDLAAKVLADLVSEAGPRPLTPQMIIETTASHYGLTVEALCGPSRTRPLVTARQVAMYLIRNLTDYSYPAIAHVFGGRNHTTVIHAVEKITSEMREHRSVYDQVTELTVSLRTKP